MGSRLDNNAKWCGSIIDDRWASHELTTRLTLDLWVQDQADEKIRTYEDIVVRA